MQLINKKLIEKKTKKEYAIQTIYNQSNSYRQLQVNHYCANWEITSMVIDQYNYIFKLTRGLYVNN